MELARITAKIQTSDLRTLFSLLQMGTLMTITMVMVITMVVVITMVAETTVMEIQSTFQT